MTTRIHCATCEVVYVLPPRIVLDCPTLAGDDAVAFMRYHAHTHTASPTLTMEETDRARFDVETRDVGPAELHAARVYMLGHDDGVVAAAAAVITFAKSLKVETKTELNELGSLPTREGDQAYKAGVSAGMSAGVSAVVARVVKEARALVRRKRW